MTSSRETGVDGGGHPRATARQRATDGAAGPVVRVDLTAGTRSLRATTEWRDRSLCNGRDGLRTALPVLPTRADERDTTYGRRGAGPHRAANERCSRTRSDGAVRARAGTESGDAASIGDTESTSSASWETEGDTVTAIEEDDGTLRREVIDGLFSSGRCRGCDELVPVLGDYVQYDPAGVLRCRGCQESETGDEEAGAAVIHP